MYERKSKIEFVENMKKRTKSLAIELIRYTQKFENRKELQVINYQIVKSATSVGANYRAAFRAISEKAMYSKMKIEEEADETLFWLEILMEICPKLINETRLLHLKYNEVLSIIAKANKTMRQKFNQNKT
ncbi:MAG: four helix bundle protein [Chitinophagales bacterium]